MSDNSKIRKPAPQYKTDWRKPVKNTATHKYTREVILSQFKISQTPSLNQCESLNNVTTSECNHPLLTPNLLFSTQLGANVNSRPAPVKRDSKEQVPEWFTEDTNAPKEEEELNKDKPITQITLTEEELLKRQNVEKQPVQITLSTIGNIKNLPQEFQGLSFDEEFSKIDEEFEQKQKAIIEDEQVPEWDDPNDEKADIQSPASAVVCYPLALIQSQMQDGNPFANIINENSTVDDAQRVIPFPNSIPYDKVWHYKDPQDNVQGPFSTIEMFNWSAAGYFNKNLMIAHSNTVHFAPLLFYSLRSKGGKVMEAKQPSKDEIATNSLKNMLGLGQTERVSWGPKQQNVVPSLSDIQKQQSRGKR